ncbi:MAG TPA: ABC transporter permease, partial [Chitinophagaceae bacterium]|nr:ABC transporter permease [Chitinophagaceae bacterium]
MDGINKSWVKGSNKFERIWLLAKIEFKLRYYENKLGLLWALLKPVMDIIIYYTVFKTILKTDVPAFASYLFIGLILWNFFVESTSGSIQILQTKKYLYEYSNMNKLDIYISQLLSNSIGFCFNLVMFIIFYTLIEPSSNGLSFTAIWILPLFVTLFLLSLGLALILSTIYIIAKDITQVWQVFVSFLFFLSPIFYSLLMFKKALPAFDYANPIAGIIINARRVLMEGTAPDIRLLAWNLLYSILFLIIG